MTEQTDHKHQLRYVVCWARGPFGEKTFCPRRNVLKTSGIVSAIRTDLGLAANCLIDNVFEQTTVSMNQWLPMPR